MNIVFKPAPHTEAIGIIKDKPAVLRKVFDAMLPDIRARAFCITGIEDANVLQRIRDRIADLPAGANWNDVREDVVKDLSPYLVTADTPEEREKQVSAAYRRAELLLRTHGFEAYAAASYNAMTETKDAFPYWQYETMGDDRVRDSHAALNGIVLPSDSPFWDDHYPPWDWGCRCTVIALSPEDVEEIKAADEKRNPEDRLVIGPEQTKRLEQAGELMRGPVALIDPDDPSRKNVLSYLPGGNFNVQSPRVRAAGEQEKNAAFGWNPGTLNLSIEQLQSRYTPKVWAAFELTAKTTLIESKAAQVTVWEWLGGADKDDGHKGAKAFGSKLKKTSAKVGGSTGAFVAEDDKGKAFIVKQYGGNKAQVSNEYIANRLYAAAGVRVPEIRLAEMDGMTGLASARISGAKPIGSAGVSAAAKSPTVKNGFVVDAWLGNWDVAGLEHDNILKAGSKYYRVDQGGSLLYRAQGKPKGAAFGTEVKELFTLRNASINPQSAALFANVTDDDIAKQIRALKRTVKLSNIQEIIAASGLEGEAANALESTLAARMENLRQWERDYTKSKKAAESSDFIVHSTTKKLGEALEPNWQALTSAERDKVKRYTGAESTRINTQALSGIGDKELDSALGGKLPRYEGILGRGIDMAETKKEWIHFDNFKTGKWANVEWRAYTSTSIEPGHKFGGNYCYFVESKGKSPGGYIGIKSTIERENEYLLGRNFRADVIGWGESEDGKKRFLFVREVPEGKKLKVSQDPPKKMTYEEVIELWKKSYNRK